MTDLEHARELLDAAKRDLRALEAMGDAFAFAEEVFGFHRVVDRVCKIAGHDAGDG